jgi:hypothetical protein
VGFMSFEMAGLVRHTLHVRRPFTIRTKWHTSVLAGVDFGSLFCPKSKTTSREDIVRYSDWIRKPRISLHEWRYTHFVLKRGGCWDVKQLVITTMSRY